MMTFQLHISMNCVVSSPSVCSGTSRYRPPRSYGRRAAFQRGHRLSRLAVSDNEQSIMKESLKQQATEQQQQQYPHSSASRSQLLWCQGLLDGTFANEVQASFPRVEWQPSSLILMLSYGLPAAAVAVLTNAQLAALFRTSSGSSSQQIAITATPDGAIHAASASLQAAGSLDSAVLQALLHLTQEGVFAAVMPLACWLALGNRVITCKWDSFWVLQTLCTCAVLFPLADPVLYNLWRPAAEAVVGAAPMNPLVTALHQAADAGSWSSVGLHCFASGVLGPIWEEVFWRGFFLTALVKVVPVPACIALSSFNFAVLHLSPHNFLPLLVLSACCDCLYLKGGGNLLPPLLLHGLWNVTQVLQIAVLHKNSFV